MSKPISSNYYGNHSLPNEQWFKVVPRAAKLKLRAWTKTLPADGASYVGITATALDKNGLPIADDERIQAQTSLGQLAETEKLSKNGEARFYLHTDATQPQPGRAQVKVAYKNKSETITIRFEEIRSGIVQGSVHDVSGNIISGASVQLVRKKNRTTTTNPDGHFFFDNVLPGDATLNISKSGYYNLRLETNATSNSAQILQPQLHPIADGTLDRESLCSRRTLRRFRTGNAYHQFCCSPQILILPSSKHSRRGWNLLEQAFTLFAKKMRRSPSRNGSK